MLEGVARLVEIVRRNETLTAEQRAALDRAAVEAGKSWELAWLFAAFAAAGAFALGVIQHKVPVIETFRGKATEAMHQKGLANWALSMGRQRLGLLTLQNHPQFLQNLKMNRLQSPTQQIDVAALDLIRDKRSGESLATTSSADSISLKQLTSFDDFVDTRLLQVLVGST